MSAVPEGLRVINLGFPKSGTTTLGRALKAADMNVADWRIRPDQDAKTRGFVGKLMYHGYFGTGDPLHYMPEFNAFSVISVVKSRRNFWPQTDWSLISAIRAHHPGARFTLSYRDPQKHADSMRRWSDLGKKRLPTSNIPGLPVGYGGAPGELERWVENHVAFCRFVFAGADDFLAYDIEDEHAKEKLEGFLGIDLPWWGQANANRNNPTAEAV